MWSLYQDGKFLSPLKFSNGKTQEDVVKEILDSINKGKKIIFIRGMCGTGKCLDKDTLIFCKPEKEKFFGYYKISDLINKTGKILSVDKEGKIIKSNFRHVRNTGKKNLYKLKTRTGREIITSKNHPFLTITKKGVEWVPLEKLNDDSYICLPSKIIFENELDYDDNKIKVLAHLIAEGKLGDKAGSPKYYQCKNQNPEVRKDYEKALQKLFPKGEIKRSSPCEVTIVFNDMNTTKGTTNKLRLFIQEHGLDRKKSKDKFIPNIIFNLDDKKVALFLKTLFSCDGSIYERQSSKKNKQIVVEYSSISKRLIKEVSLLLGRFGIHHTITSKKFGDINDYVWRVSISNYTQVRKFIENIGFIGRKQKLAIDLYRKTKIHKFTNIDKVPRVIREYLNLLGYNYTQLDRFLNYEEIKNLRKIKGFKRINQDKLVKTPCVFKQGKIDFLRQHIKKINEYIKDETLSFICNDGIIWDKIKSSEYVKKDEVYDLEVPEHNNFIADGIIVHNSAIALNVAKNLGKTSIVVPIKSLQEQYKRDYENSKYVLKNNGEKLKISVITGRNNHKCKFLEDNKNAIPKIKKEVNANLHDIFEGKRENINKTIGNDLSADNYNIPCKIEIKEKNWNKLKEYIKQNKKVNYREFLDIKDVKRASVASVCPYWSPVLPDKYELKIFENSKKRTYKGLNNTNFVFYQRTPGCGFYEQFNSFIDADVIVFNSLKYKLESSMNRKPLTEIEIIDECDEFLDSFSNQKSLNIDKLQNSLKQIFPNNIRIEKFLETLNEKIRNIKQNKKIIESIYSKSILSLKETPIYDLLKTIVESYEVIEDSGIDEESYFFDVFETAKMFEDFFDDSYLTSIKKDSNLIISLVTTNLEKRFREMIDKNKIIVLMSGTLHSEEVLRGIFGIEDFKIIDAESKHQGQIEIIKTGAEIDCRYDNFSRGKFSREQYLKALSKCITAAKKPILVHINSFMDLPSEEEVKKFQIYNITSRERVKELQKNYKDHEIINMFKTHQIDILFSTKCSRGVDFPGEQCNSIIFTKYPNPDVKNAFWQILKKTHPQQYWSFYKDKAKRELLQRIYRGLRFKEDHVYLLSPDSRVLEAFEK